MTIDNVEVFFDKAARDANEKGALRKVHHKIAQGAKEDDDDDDLEEILEFVLLGIAQGILGWIGAEIMDVIFGSSRRSQINLQSLVTQLVDGVGAIVRRSIHENEMRILSANLSALEFSLVHYRNAPEQIDRLQNATNDATKLVAQLESMKLLGHRGYMIAASLWITILQEREKRFGGERANIKYTTDKIIEQVELRHLEWREWHLGRYSWKPWPFSRHLSGELVTIYEDGEQIGGKIWKRDLESKMREIIEARWPTVKGRFVDRSQIILDEWKKFHATLD